MTKVIGIRFKRVGKMYYFDPGELTLRKDDAVIIETQHGTDYGRCVTDPMEIEDEKIVPPLRRVLRTATEQDEQTLRDNEERGKRAIPVCRDKAKAHGLEMKIVDAEYVFDGSKVIFYFTADGRVDFRELVKDLAGTFRTRIELKQIGVRDEAKMLGGLGICGKSFCCSDFLDDFQPVSIKMAKEQSLSLNPTKISGVCGRLMCCLKYEQNAYEHLRRITPRVDSMVKTPHGKGTVVDVSLLRGNLKVRLENAPDAVPKTVHRTQVTQLGPSRTHNGTEPAGFDPDNEEL